MMTLTGAETLIRLLEQQGIGTVTRVLYGDASSALTDALRARGTIRHVWARHEQSAGFIAQGMARVTGKPQVCIAAVGAEGMSLLPVLSVAKRDFVPLVCITHPASEEPLDPESARQDGSDGLRLPVCKYSVSVRNVRHLLEVIPEAFRIAASDAPGPVSVHVPLSVLSETWCGDDWPEPAGATGNARPTTPLELARLAALVNSAQRPLLYLGDAVVTGGASECARELAERTNAPVVTSLNGLGCLPAQHPLALGALDVPGARHIDQALEECDLLVTVGAHGDGRVAVRCTRISPRARVVHVGVGSSGFCDPAGASVTVRGDARSVLKAIMPVARPNPRVRWLARMEALRENNPTRLAEVEDVRRPHDLVRFIGERIGDDAIVVADAGPQQMWVAQAFPFRRSGRWLSPGSAGTRGYGIPAAIGAALAAAGAQVVCFTGEDGVLRNLQELTTAAREGINLKIVLTSGGAPMVRRQPPRLHNGDWRDPFDCQATADFPVLARSFGITAFDLGRLPDPTAVLVEALALPGPVLVHVPIEKADPMWPPTASERGSRAMIGGQCESPSRVRADGAPG